MPCHEQHCHTESPDVRGEGPLLPASETCRCYIVRRATVIRFGGRGSEAGVAQNGTATVRAKDDVGGFDIVVEDPFSMDVGDGIADIGPDMYSSCIAVTGQGCVTWVILVRLKAASLRQIRISCSAGTKRGRSCSVPLL